MTYTYGIIYIFVEYTHTILFVFIKVRSHIFVPFTESIENVFNVNFVSRLTVIILGMMKNLHINIYK